MYLDLLFSITWECLRLRCCSDVFQMILIITPRSQSHCLLSQSTLLLRTAHLPATPSPKPCPPHHTSFKTIPTFDLFTLFCPFQTRPVISLKHNTIENSCPSVPLVYVVSIRPSVFIWRLCEGALSSCAAMHGDRLAFIMCDDVHLQETEWDNPAAAPAATYRFIQDESNRQKKIPNKKMKKQPKKKEQIARLHDCIWCHYPGVNSIAPPPPPTTTSLKLSWSQEQSGWWRRDKELVDRYARCKG